METVIQKAVELGAAEIVPVASRRCVVRLDAKKAAAKVKRWNAVAANAAEQAMRMAVPSVQEVMELPAALAYAAAMTSPGGAEPVLLMPYERARDMAQTRRILGQIRPGQTVAVLIGPEGGFEEPEAAQAEAAGFAPVTLGKRILRTETAGMAVLSVLAYLLEEDGGPS